MPRYTDKQIEKALHEAKGLIGLAAKRLNCERLTIRTRVAKSEHLREVINEEREMMVDTAVGKLAQAINNGQPWAIQFFLKTQGKDRGYTERQEISGPNAGPVQTEDVSLSDDDRAARILAIVQRARDRAARAAGLTEPDLGTPPWPAD